MEKRIFLLIVCLTILLFQGCKTTQSTYKLALEPPVAKNQEMIDREGHATIMSTNKNTSVMVRPASDTFASGDYPTIFIGLYGEKSFEFSADNIKAFVDGKPLRIMTGDEMIAEIKERYQGGLKSIKEKYDAQTRQAVETSKKDPNDPDVFEPNPARRNRTVPGSTEASGYKIDYNQIGRANVDAANKADVERAALKEEMEKQLKTILSKSLKPGDVPPNTWYRGQVSMAKIPDPDKPHNIKVIVTALGEKHEFLLKTLN